MVTERTAANGCGPMSTEPCQHRNTRHVYDAPLNEPTGEGGWYSVLRACDDCGAIMVALFVVDPALHAGEALDVELLWVAQP